MVTIDSLIKEAYDWVIVKLEKLNVTSPFDPNNWEDEMYDVVYNVVNSKKSFDLVDIIRDEVLFTEVNYRYHSVNGEEPISAYEMGFCALIQIVTNVVMVKLDNGYTE